MYSPILAVNLQCSVDWAVVRNDIQVVKVSLFFEVVQNICTSWGIEQNNRDRVRLKFMEEKMWLTLSFYFEVKQFAKTKFGKQIRYVA